MLLGQQDGRLGGVERRPAVACRRPVPAIPAGLAAERGAAAVEHAGPHVIQRVGRVVEPVPVPVEAEERVLHDVLGRAAVPEHDEPQPDQAHGMRRVQRGHAFVCPWPRLGSQRRIGVQEVHESEMPPNAVGCRRKKTSHETQPRARHDRLTGPA
jgi:hypothetical protein